MATRDEIVTRVYQLLGDPSDVEEFDETTVILPKIENIVSRICKGEYINPQTSRISRSGYLPFLDTSVFYTSVLPVALTADVATTDVTISFDTTDFYGATALDPQYILINGDIIQYTGQTGTSITGVTGIGMNHTAGDYVYQLYKLPTNISKPHSLRRIGSTQIRYKVDFRDFKMVHEGYKFYTILRDGVQDLLNIVGYGEENFILYYNAINSTMSSGTTECIIPDCIEVVAHLAAGELLYEYEEYEDGLSKINHGQVLLDEMYSYYAKQNNDKDRKIVTGNPVRFSQAYGFNGKRSNYYYG